MDPEGLRLTPLASWMRDAGIDVQGALRADLLAGGRSNISYRIRDEGDGDWVVRRPPLGHILPSAHDMGREFRVLSGLNRVGFPAPHAVALGEDTEVIGSSFVLMDFVPGRTIADATAAARLTAEQATRTSASLVDTLADLHAIDPVTAGLGELGRPDGYLERQVSRWTRQWELTQTRELPDIDRLAGLLAQRVGDAPASDGSGALVHGDYRLDNTILAPDEDVVRAVVDWEMSTLGDPVMDLAIMLVYWTESGDGLRTAVPVAEHITDRPGFSTRADLISRYAERTGRDLVHLDLCTAIACFKLAVIMESILARSLQGQQLGAGASEVEGMRAATTALAALGLQVLDSGTIDGLRA